MRNVFGVATVAAVCAGCCALPLAMPALRSVASSVSVAFRWEAAAVAATVAFAMRAVLIHWRTRREEMSSHPREMQQLDALRKQVASTKVKPDAQEALACNSPDTQMLARVTEIAGLARRGLLAHQQCGPSLYLRYTSAVAHELERLVAQERECTPYLDFELVHRVDAVHLVITAPAAVADSAPALTSHFLGKVAQRRACTPSCGCNPKAITGSA